MASKRRKWWYEWPRRHLTSSSTRAYRMKIDEWGLRKYKPNKRAKRSLRVPQSLSEPPPNMEGGSSSYSSDALRPSTETDLECPEPEEDDKLRLSRESALLSNSLETLLTKWSPLAHVGAISSHAEYRNWINLSSRHQGPLIFRLVEDLVPHEEQFNIGKYFLESDLDSQRRPAYPYAHWKNAWNETLNSGDWEDAKERLSEGIIYDIAGHSFKEYAQVVIAERQLVDCKTELDYYRQSNRVLRVFEIEEASRQRKKYLDILKDFRHSDRDVSPSWYKYCLEIIEWEAARNKDFSSKDVDHVADEYRHRYLKLIAQCYIVHTAPPAESTGSMYSRTTRSIELTIIVLTPLTIPDTNDLSNTHTALVRPSSRDQPSRNDPSSTREAFDNLMLKWKFLKDFNEYAHHIVAKDGWPVFIFDAPFPSSENLFSIIASDVPFGTQIPFVKSLLVAFSSVKLTEHYSPWSLSWWNSVYTAPSWEVFQTRLDAGRISGHLERIMSPEAVKLFLDATTLLVGERLLLDLKTMLVADRREKSGKVDTESLKSQYTDVLREFRARKLAFDQTWVEYLINFM
jgi:hypothetical protein